MPATGKITQVIGSTFDAEFPEDSLPAIYNAVKIDAQNNGASIRLTGEIASHLGGGRVRAVALGVGVIGGDGKGEVAEPAVAQGFFRADAQGRPRGGPGGGGSRGVVGAAGGAGGQQREERGQGKEGRAFHGEDSGETGDNVRGRPS